MSTRYEVRVKTTEGPGRYDGLIPLHDPENYTEALSEFDRVSVKKQFLRVELVEVVESSLMLIARV